MTAVQQLFQRLRAERDSGTGSTGGKAFMPFITAGDPDLEFTAELIRRLDACGCSMCEVGVPYSDPIADGPVIQASYTRALSQGVSLTRILEMLGSVSGSVSMPLVTMVSYPIVYRQGLERFIERARAAGLSGAIIPDLLVEEAAEMIDTFRRLDFDLIQLVTPTTSRERALRIAETSTGFLYYVSVTGITGERTELPAKLAEDVAWLRDQIDLPVCIGFGISQPEHVRALAPSSDGLIVGSAIVRRVADAEHQPRQAVLDDIVDYVQSLIAALK